MTTTAQNSACDLILFGTKGDLARRKLLPAMYQLEKAAFYQEIIQLLESAQ